MRGFARRWRVASMVAVAGLAVCPRVGHADLAVDLRATSATNGVVIDSGGKAVQVNGAGDAVTMSIFARVSGTDGEHNESLNICSGGFFSSTGQLLGNLSASTAPLFSQPGSSNGSVQDLDSDGDLDVGSSGTMSAGKFSARAVGFVSVTSPVDVNSAEILIGTLTFSLTGSEGTTTVMFIPRPATTGGAAQWMEDATETKTPANGTFVALSPVQVGMIPEPGSALSLVGTIVLMMRKRWLRRRQ